MYMLAEHNIYSWASIRRLEPPSWIFFFLDWAQKVLIKKFSNARSKLTLPHIYKIRITGSQSVCRILSLLNNLNLESKAMNHEWNIYPEIGIVREAVKYTYPWIV